MLDIRDFDSGDVYYAITSMCRGGRCVMNGMFIAAWRTKHAAVTAAAGDPDFTIVKCRKP